MAADLEGMVASRPGGGYSSVSDGPKVSIGNYKGVMLCNRPFAGVSAAARAAANTSDGQVQWKPAHHTDEPLGLNPARKTFEFVVVDRSKSKKNSALSKHKQWLRDLGREKNKMHEEMLAEQKRRADRKARFMEDQRQMRMRVKEAVRAASPNLRDDVARHLEGKHGGGGGAGGAGAGGGMGAMGGMGEGKYGGDEPEATPEFDAEELAGISAAQQRQLDRAAAAHAKPKWAMTAAADEEEKEEEADELLAFADGLDFEKYVDDLEVRSALAAITKRISEIEKEGTPDRAEGKDAGDGGARVSAFAHGEGKYTEDEVMNGLVGLGVDPSLLEPDAFPEAPRERPGGRGGGGGGGGRYAAAGGSPGGGGGGFDDDARSVGSARSYMTHESIKSLKQIHSNQSLAAISRRVAAEADAGLPAIDDDEGDGPPTLDGPRVVSHSAKNKKADNPSNLPYIHRNPAV